MSPDVVSIDSVLDAYRRLMRALHVEAASPGVDPWSDCPMTLPQLRALTLIATSERGLSSRELATGLGVGASAITPLVDRLVDRGFALRNEDPHDRRIARLHATETGLVLLERMRAGQTTVLREALSQLDSFELTAVGAALDLLRAGLQRARTATTRTAIQLPQGTPA